MDDELNQENMSRSFSNSSEDVVVSVDGISKKFCRDLKQALFYGLRDISTEVLGLRGLENNHLRKKEFWALQDVSFKLKRGEAIALIGRNGSGKSTLLRIITGLIKPDTGTITVNGRIAPLIALGAGFNPILTGRENIYANMSVLGLTKEQIDERFDAVVDFAEVDNAIDAPVQSYSSGMAARLGFACAVYTEPDILVIDEVLAVGDVQFRFKCFRRLAELRRKGIAFILVSHNTNSVLSLCDSAVYLQNGIVQSKGRTSEVMKIYENDALIDEEASTVFGKLTFPPKPVEKSLGADITSLFFKDGADEEITTLLSGEPATFCMGCKIHRPLDDARMVVVINSKSSEDGRMLSLSNSIDETQLGLKAGDNIVEMHMPHVGLPPGTYTMSTNIRQGPLEILDSYKGFEFKVENKLPISECRFYQPREWRTTALTTEERETEKKEAETEKKEAETREVQTTLAFSAYNQDDT